jgi:hypothetical protein
LPSDAVSALSAAMVAVVAPVAGAVPGLTEIA